MQITRDQLDKFLDEMGNGLVPAYGYLQMGVECRCMPAEDIDAALKSCERAVKAIHELRETTKDME